MVMTRTEVRELLDRHGITPSRALGQNFLVDPNVVDRIARLAGVGAGDRVVEVGGGVGCLTSALAATGAAVTTVEIDRYLVPLLRDALAHTDVRVVHGDATTLDWDGLLSGADSPPATQYGWVMVANLPYNVGTDIVLDVLDRVPAIERLVVMVQQEVADRLVAPLGTREAGIPSVKVAYWAEASIVMQVGPDVFLPRPRVASAIVELRRLPAPAVDTNPKVMFSLVRQAFGQRRKMLRRSLAGSVQAGQFDAADVPGTARPEQLDIHAWGRLTNVVAMGKNQ